MHLLFIVARDRPEVHLSLKVAYSGDSAVEVIYDRRLGEPRRGPGADGRRPPERRRLDVTDSLRKLGWAVVEAQEASATT